MAKLAVMLVMLSRTKNFQGYKFSLDQSYLFATQFLCKKCLKNRDIDIETVHLTFALLEFDTMVPCANSSSVQNARPIIGFLC